MFSLVFEFRLGENQIMLPIGMTGFEERKENGVPYLLAHFNGETFELKGSLAGINYEIQRAMQPHSALSLK